MKGKRLAALVLAVVMAFSLLAVPAGAVSFTDMVGHWARADVEHLATEGIVNGTSATTFSPSRLMTACEALLFCSRTTGVTAAAKAKIYADWLPVAQRLLPSEMVSWAAEEMAVCLATGIISETELQAMTTSGNITRSITRETLAMYLVRAMQLSKLAESLTSYSMGFSDASAISPALQPYVYLLYMYGIVKGDQANRFQPQGALTRAEMATMLRRAMDFMDERGIYAELPEYADYEWLGGVISQVETGANGTILLTLSNEISGTRAVSLPADIEIYENNMLTTTSALKLGQYVRVNLSANGIPYSLRVGGALTTYTGAITSLSQDQVTISVSGVSKALEIDRFTEVQAGKNSGGQEVIDSEAGYTTAVCRVDEQGHLAQLQLSGGTIAIEGILTSVEAMLNGGHLLQVTGFNGVTKPYTLPFGAPVTINGQAGSLTARYVGSYVNLRISDDDLEQLEGVDVDSVTEYIQGALRDYDTSGRYSTVTITNLINNQSASYDVAAGAVVRFDGAAVALDSVRKGSYVTARLAGNEVTLLEAYPAASETEGTLESIRYGTDTLMTVRLEDGQMVTFTLNLSSLPEIYRDGKVSAIDRLISGDGIVVTTRYGQVETIEAYAQTVNVSGTITRITMVSSGVTLDLTLSSGEQMSCTVSEGVAVTQGGEPVSLYSLKPDYRVSMVVSGTTVVSIEVDKTTSANGLLNGTVLLSNIQEQTLLIKQEDGTPLTVDVAFARFMRADSTTTTQSWLQTDDVVQVYGSYSGSTFVATLVIVL